MNKKEAFLELLKTYNLEQDLQFFLETNTEFIPREFVQNHGIHNRLVFRKLKLAEHYTTDFFYLCKSSDDWNCVLIELEKPKSKFFKEGSNELHQDFLSGLDQIDKWRAWFSNNDNKEFFTKQTLSFIRQPLFQNPCYIKYVLVTGRREEYNNSDLRKSLVHAKERDDFKIITFDSLCEAFEEHSQLYLCVKKNEYIEIHNDNLLSKNVFEWIPVEHLRVKQSLKDQLIKTSEDFISSAENSGKEYQKLSVELAKKTLENWKQIITIPKK